MEPPSGEEKVLECLQTPAIVLVGLWLRQFIFVIILVTADIVNDGGELTLAQGTHSPHLGPLQQTRETELVETRVGHGLVVNITQTDGTRLFWIRR